MSAASQQETTRRVMLLFGCTGATGKHVLMQALAMMTADEEDKVLDLIVLYVRNKEKLPSQVLQGDAKDKIAIVVGDCLDAAAVQQCVSTYKPSSIIFTTNVGFTSELVKLNQLLVPCVVDTLQRDGRLQACRLVYLSGSGSPNPPRRDFDPFFSFVVWLVSLRGAVMDNIETQEYLCLHAHADVCFTIVKMGLVSDRSSKGKLVHKTCSDDQKWGAAQICGTPGVAFVDVASLLCSLAATPVGAQVKAGEAKIDRALLLMEYC